VSDVPAGVASDGPAIVVDGVAKHYGVVPALDGCSLSVGTSEIVAVTGPSGCGKSTLLHLIAALERPDSGSITVLGSDLAHIHNLSQFRREEIGLVFQLHYLLPRLSVSANVELAMFGTHRGPEERRRRAGELLDAVDLDDCASRLPTELSGGERQRVAIARALANEPRVLLADEPTGSLEPASAARVMGLFTDARESMGLTVLIVTHDPAIARQADRILEMAHGRIDGRDPPTAPPAG